jgi:hypothetical protein
MLSVAKPAPFTGTYSNLGGIARIEQSEMLEYGQGQQPRFDGSGLMNHENLAQYNDENAGMQPTVGEYDHYLRNMEQFQEYVNQNQAEESQQVKQNQGTLDPSMLLMASNDDFDFDRSVPSQPQPKMQGPLDPSLLMMASNDDLDFDRSHPGVQGPFGAIRQENVYTFNNAESINNFGDPHFHSRSGPAGTDIFESKQPNSDTSDDVYNAYYKYQDGMEDQESPNPDLSPGSVESLEPTHETGLDGDCLCISELIPKEDPVPLPLPPQQYASNKFSEGVERIEELISDEAEDPTIKFSQTPVNPTDDEDPINFFRSNASNILNRNRNSDSKNSPHQDSGPLYISDLVPDLSQRYIKKKYRVATSDNNPSNVTDFTEYYSVLDGQENIGGNHDEVSQAGGTDRKRSSNIKNRQSSSDRGGAGGGKGDYLIRINADDIGFSESVNLESQIIGGLGDGAMVVDKSEVLDSAKGLGNDAEEGRASEGNYYISMSRGKSQKSPVNEGLGSGRGESGTDRGIEPASFLSPDPYSVLLNPSRISIEDQPGERIAGSFEARSS